MTDSHESRFWRNCRQRLGRRFSAVATPASRQTRADDCIGSSISRERMATGQLLGQAQSFLQLLLERLRARRLRAFQSAARWLPTKIRLVHRHLLVNFIRLFRHWNDFCWTRRGSNWRQRLVGSKWSNSSRRTCARLGYLRGRGEDFRPDACWRRSGRHRHWQRLRMLCVTTESVDWCR